MKISTNSNKHEGIVSIFLTPSANRILNSPISTSSDSTESSTCSLCGCCKNKESEECLKHITSNEVLSEIAFFMKTPNFEETDSLEDDNDGKCAAFKINYS